MSAVWAVRVALAQHRSCCSAADDVPAEVKSRRLTELFTAYWQGQAKLNTLEVGRVHLVLLDGRPRRDGQYRASEALQGRTDTMKRVIIPEQQLPVSLTSLYQYLRMDGAASGAQLQPWHGIEAGPLGPTTAVGIGDFVAVHVQRIEGRSRLICAPIAKTSISEFAQLFGSCSPAKHQVPSRLQLSAARPAVLPQRHQGLAVCDSSGGP